MSAEEQIRQAIDDAIDAKESSIGWVELAQRAGVEPDEVLDLLDRLADDPASGVRRHAAKAL